jgi:DNA transposition AAA+ family ATPase
MLPPSPAAPCQADPSPPSPPPGHKLRFIPTELTAKIWKVCDAAREFQKIAFIFGDQQIGKTEALKAYRDTHAHHHGPTIYVRVPAGGALGSFLLALARPLRIGENLPATRLRERIKAACADRLLLIVDEAHTCIKEAGRSQNSVQTIDYLREIFDETQCGLVICSTNIFRDAMDRGPVEKILRQTRRRRLCALQLPNVPARADLNTFAAAYGLPPAAGPARDLETRLIQTEALGMWLTLLRMGAKIATQRKTRLKWEHVLTAHAGLQQMAGQTC